MIPKSSTPQLKTLPEKKKSEAHRLNIKALKEEVAIVPEKIQVVDKEQIYNTFLFWFSLPPKHRKPQTFQEFADFYKISLSDIAEFQERDTFGEGLYKAAQKWGKSKVPELLHIAFERAKSSGKPSDVESFTRLITLDKDEKKNGNTYNLNVFNPSDEQYRQILERESSRVLTDSSEAKTA